MQAVRQSAPCGDPCFFVDIDSVKRPFFGKNRTRHAVHCGAVSDCGAFSRTVFCPVPRRCFRPANAVLRQNRARCGAPHYRRRHSSYAAARYRLCECARTAFRLCTAVLDAPQYARMGHRRRQRTRRHRARQNPCRPAIRAVCGLAVGIRLGISAPFGSFLSCRADFFLGLRTALHGQKPRNPRCTA